MRVTIDRVKKTLLVKGIKIDLLRVNRLAAQLPTYKVIMIVKG